jgi:hypothetical protein
MSFWSSNTCHVNSELWLLASFGYCVVSNFETSKYSLSDQSQLHLVRLQNLSYRAPLAEP